MNFVKYLGATAVAAGVAMMIGCGGSSVTTGNPIVATMNTGQGTATGGGTNTTIPVTIGGAAATAVVPPGAVVNNGDLLFVILAGSNLSSVFPNNRVVMVGTDLNNPANVSPSQAQISTNGVLAQNLALPPGNFVISIGQGRTRRPDTTPKDLTFQNLEVLGRVFIQGGLILNTYPTDIQGVNLNDGTSTLNGRVTATFGPGAIGKPATLKVWYTSPVNRAQPTITRGPTIVPANGVVTWDATGGTVIPNTGVQIIQIECK